MAMTKCSECGHDVSTKASLCPSCGAPRASEAQLRAQQDPLGLRQPVSKGLWITVVAVVVVVGLLAIAGGKSNSSSDASISAAQTTGQPPSRVVYQGHPDSVPPEPDIDGAINSVRLHREYLSEFAETQQRLLGRPLLVSGKVIKVDKVDLGLGHARMALLEGGPKGTVDSVMTCFNDSCSDFRRTYVSDEQFEGVRVGARIVVQCVPQPAQAFATDTPMVDVTLSQCTLVKTVEPSS